MIEDVGVRLQRGRIKAVLAEGLIVQSEESGVTTQAIKNLLSTSPALESRVLFVEFDDGEGAVIALL